MIETTDDTTEVVYEAEIVLVVGLIVAIFLIVLAVVLHFLSQ